MNIPATLQAGDTLTWTDSLSEYPATTYTLNYSLRAFGLSVINIAATASGTDHAVAATAATTAGWAAGDYAWTAYVEKGAGASLERYTIATGSVTVKPALHTALSSADNRSMAVKMLAALEAAILRLTSKEVESLTFNGRTVTYKDLGKLMQERSRLRAEVASEKAAEKIAQGLDPGRRILVRF